MHMKPTKNRDINAWMLGMLRPDLRGGAVLNVLSGLFAEADEMVTILWVVSFGSFASFASWNFSSFVVCIV